MDISVVIPLLNEEESLRELAAWIAKVMEDNKFSYEVLFIDDGSKDNSWSVIGDLSNENKNIKGVRFARNYGKSAALYVGFGKALGDVVITMDADLQDSPDEIPQLYHMIKEEGFDLVSGWKKNRHDPRNKTIPSKIFNFTARVVSGIKLHDFNCGIKAYKNKVIKNIEVYGEMHRYIPILSKQAGFKNIGEKVVEHNARKYGISKYGWERMIRGYLDLITVMFLTRFGKNPMYLFGLWGTILFLAGGILAVYTIAIKLQLQSVGMPVRAVTDQPAFFIALTAIIIGTQMFLSGFIGELIVRRSGDRNDYLIEDTI